MRYLKHFESERDEVFGCDKDDIKECFDSYLDDYTLQVIFGKKLHQFDVMDVNVTTKDVKLGFQPYIRVRMIPRQKLSPYELSSVLSSYDFDESKLETQSRLSDYDLVIKNVEIEVSSIVFLIYKQ